MKWGIRAAVGGLLVVGLILAVLDFSRKGEMTRTGNAWTAALDQSVASGAPLEFAKIEPMIAGKPARSERDVARPKGSTADVTRVYEYVWSGPIRKYKIAVHAEAEDKGDALVVTKVDVGGRAE
jgi:hypothetical protein